MTEVRKIICDRCKKSIDAENEELWSVSRYLRNAPRSGVCLVACDPSRRWDFCGHCMQAIENDLNEYGFARPQKDKGRGRSEACGQPEESALGS